MWSSDAFSRYPVEVISAGTLNSEGKKIISAVDCDDFGDSWEGFGVHVPDDPITIIGLLFRWELPGTQSTNNIGCLPSKEKENDLRQG